MKHCLYILICAAFAVLTLAEPIEAQTTPIRIVVFGDSLTSGYQLSQEKNFPTILQQKILSEGYQTEVINMSRDGQTSADAFARIDEVIAAKPDLVLIQLGYNDAIRGLNPEKTLYKNLHRIASRLVKKKVGLLILGVTPPQHLGKEYARTHRHIFRQTARNHSSALYPDVLTSIQSRPDLTLADGVHPNANGVLTMVHSIAPYVKRLVQWRINLQNFENSSK